MPSPERQTAFADGAVMDAVLKGLIDGKYHLVLGAGASFGCSNAQGPVPMAPQLETILLDEIGLKNSDPVGLPRAFEAAVAQLGEPAVESLLRARFSDVEPDDWHRLIPLIPWEAIWSFNIDDIVERAYETTPARRQTVSVRLPSDDQLPFGGSHDETPLVHLHGYVGAVGSRQHPELVFSWNQYLDTVRHSDKPSWHGRFRGDYELRPAVIVGARLNEELDILEVLRRGNQSARIGFPSVIVRPGITEFDRQEYERWGLVPIDARADEFFAYVSACIAATPAPVVEGEYATRYTDRVLLPLNDGAPARPPGHDFYGGHAPEWADVVDALDAVPRWLLDLVEEIGTATDLPQIQRLYLLKGPPFCGKSSSLLRLGRELERKGWSPILLIGRERIEYEATLEYFRTRPNAVLLMDGLAQDAGDIGELLRRAQGLGQRLLVLASERERHLPHITNVVSSKHLVGAETTLFVEPTNDFWLRIVDVRERYARLGRLEGVGERDRALHFVQHGRELFSALASLEDAGGFIDRGLQVYQQLEDRLRGAFTAVALLGRFGLPAPIAAVCAASGVAVRSFMDEVSTGGALSQWLVPDDSQPGYVRLRHRYLADLLLTGRADTLHHTPLREVSQSICLALADQMGPKTIRRKTLPHRIVAALMDLESVQMVCRTQNVDDWYEQLESAYGWSARYWEQRALGLATSPERAYSYAKRAVRLHSDAFTLNTLGTILMRRSVELAGVIGPAQRKSYWIEAVEALSGSRTRGAGRFEHPYVTFFAYTARLLALEDDMDNDWLSRAEDAYREWRADAAAKGLFDHAQIRRLVSEFPAEWRR